MKKVFTLLIAAAMLMFTGLPAANAQTYYYGSSIASTIGAIGTDADQFIGNGSWKNNQTASYFEMYLDLSVFGSFTIDEIDYIKFATKKGTDGTQPDFFVKLYTVPDGTDDKASWYGYRLNAEPYFSNNLNAPANQWNEWHTSSATNELTFFDQPVTGSYGWTTGQPTLANLQAGSIDWNSYYTANPVTNIDYGAEQVKFITLGTGSGWNSTFDGLLDQIIISVNGTVVTWDLEGSMPEVWVDDDWVGSTAGAVVGGTHIFGNDAFATIADGISAVIEGGTVNVAAGTYNESPTISKSLSLLGAGRDMTNIVLQTAPNYTGSLLVGGANVTVSGFTITGFDAVGSGVASTNIYLNSIAVNVTISNNKLLVGKIGSGSTGDDGFGFITEYNVPATPVSNLTVIGNIIQPVGTEGQRIFYVNPGVDNFSFTNNTITGQFNGTAITQAKNGLVENNTITGTGSSGGIGTWGNPDAAIYGHTIFRGNEISQVSRGIAIYAANDVTIENNTLSNNVDGIWVGYDEPNFDPTTISISSNNISGSTGYGVNNTTPANIDATCNWWGTAVEADVAAEVTANVIYAPFSVSEGGACLGGIPATTVVAIIGAPSSTECGTWDVPVTVKNFKNIGSISLRLTYDVAKLQLKSIPEAEGPWPGVTINPAIAALAIPNEIAPGTFTLGYYIGITDPEVTLPDNAVLFTLHLTKVPLSAGTTSLAWKDEPNTGYCEFSAKNGTVYSSIFNDEQEIDIPTWPVKNIDTGLDYCTIQAAIDAVETLNGHTITVAAGTYPENVVVNKSGLIIKGANTGNSAGRYPEGRVTESIINGSVTIVSSVNGFTLDGFSLKATVASAKLITGGGTGTITVENNILDGDNLTGTSGVWNGGAWVWSVLNNSFSNFKYWGIMIDGNVIGASTFSGNLFENNTGTTGAIILQGSVLTGQLVTDNKFINNTPAVVLGSGNHTFYRNLVESGSGIYAVSGGNFVSENEFINPSYAFYLQAAKTDNILVSNSLLGGYTSGTNIGKSVFGYAGGIVTAKCNWWGTTDPAVIQTKVNGSLVTFTPWLLNGVDGDFTTAGFQPSVTCDETPPALTCPDAVTVDQHADRDPYATGYATTTDPADVITYNDDRSGLDECNATGIITRTWTAIDLAGNKSTCQQIITVQDVDNPVVVVPADITVNNDPGVCTAVVTYDAPTATDFGFFQGFEHAGWVAGAPYPEMPSTNWNQYQSPIVRTASGTDGITSKTGAAHAVVTEGTGDWTGIFSRLGGFYNSFGNGYVTSVDVYLDLSDDKVALSTYGFDVSTGVNKPDGNHLRDFIFHAAGEPGKILIAGSNNSNFARQGNLASINHYEVTTTGWYTLEWNFRDMGDGSLAVDLNLRDASGSLLWTETRNTTTDIIETIASGTRYMWFTFLAADKLAIDNTTLTRKLAVTPASLSGTAFAKGTTTVSATATDACGKITTSSFTVTVVDNEAPVITGPADIAIECDASILPSVTGEPTVTDNCPGTPAVTHSDAPGQLISSTFPGGTAIQGRARWGASGFEGALYIGGTSGPNLNPVGTPVWVLGTPYAFDYSYDASSGDHTLKIDFNNDLSYGAGEVITQATSFAGQGFKYFSIFMSGNATRGITLNNFVVNGVSLGNYVSPATGSIDLAWENSAGYFEDILATGTITFTGIGGSGDETGRIWLRTAVPVAIPAAPAVTCAGNYVINRVWTATDDDGNKSMKIQKITVADNTKPVFTATTLDPVTVHVNNEDCTYDGTIAEPVVTDNCSSTIDLTNDMPVDGWPVGEHVITWTAIDKCGNFETKAQTVTVVKNKVSGKMVYYNAAETPMGNVTMELYEGAVLKGTAITSIVSGKVGEFEFAGLCNGTYKVVVTNNNKETGFINNTDAILVNSWSANPVDIEQVKFLAGDVTFEKFISSADALKIQRQYVFGDVFAAPLWSYWKKGDLLIESNAVPYNSVTNTPPWPTDITVTVDGGDVTLDLYAMGTGDFNGSFTPNMLKSANPSLILTENSNLQVGTNQTFELPIFAASAMQVSAVSMSLLIPSNLVEVQDVVMKNSETPVVWAMKGNELRIGWYSLDPVNVAENGSLLTLRLKTSNAFTAGQSLDISLPFDPLNELADGSYKAMESAELMVAKVGNQTVGNIAIDKNGGLLFSNYPNPFSKVTTLEYSLPVDGKVTLNLYNNLGQLVSVLVDADQSAGQHNFRYESNTLQPGIYVAKLRLVNGETDMVGTIKLSVQK